MRVNVISSVGKKGVVESLDNGGLQFVEGDITRDDMIEDLRFVRPNSACGLVNTIENDAAFVLRSLETVGWEVEWPEVEGSDEPDDGVPGADLEVN